MMLFNGSTGSLGAYLGPALDAAGSPGVALRARLEQPEQLRAELEALASAAPLPPRLTFVQLAAKVSVPDCERDPEQAEAINVTAAARCVTEVCAFARRAGSELRVIYVSSGHVYAVAPEGERLTEQHPLGPRSVYARTKLAGERAVADAASAYDYPCLVARVFGLVAPQQPPNYVLPGLARRVREGALGAVPGLSFSRDYLDARDVCAVLVKLAGRETFSTGVLNVCSGVPVSLKGLLELLVQALRPDDAEALMRAAVEAPARPDDVPWIVGDPARLRALIGSEPQQIALARTVRDHVAAYASS